MDEITNTVEAWWRHAALAQSEARADRLASDDLQWAWEAVDEVIATGGLQAVNLVAALVEAAPGEAVEREMTYLGAGPLEDLLVAHGGDAVVFAAVMERSRRDPSFRLALEGVWLEDAELPPATRPEWIRVGLRFING